MSSTQRSYFEQMYARSPDPWALATSWYERRKYELTVAALPDSRYRSAFEPGCSIGVLSALLARRCDRLLSTDILPDVVEQAAARLGDEHVRVELRAIPEQWPEGEFDLVVLSEIAYYFEAATLSDVVGRVVGSTAPGAAVVGVHWRGVTDYSLSGDAAHAVIDASRHVERIGHYEESDFLLDVWRRVR